MHVCTFKLHMLNDSKSHKESTCQCRRHKRRWFDPWVGKTHWRRRWQPTPVFLPGESHGQRSAVSYSLWDHRVGCYPHGHEQGYTCLHKLTIIHINPAKRKNLRILLILCKCLGLLKY